MYKVKHAQKCFEWHVLQTYIMRRTAVCRTGIHNVSVVEPLSIFSSRPNRRGGSTSRQNQDSPSGPGLFQGEVLSFHGELHAVPLVLLLLKLPGFVTREKMFLFSKQMISFLLLLHVSAQANAPAIKG